MNVLTPNDMLMVSGGSKRSERLKGQNAFAQIGTIAKGGVAGAIAGGALGGFVAGGPAGAGLGALYGGLAGSYTVVHFKLYK